MRGLALIGKKKTMNFGLNLAKLFELEKVFKNASNMINEFSEKEYKES